MAEFFETFIPAPVFDAKKKGGKSVSGFFGRNAWNPFLMISLKCRVRSSSDIFIRLLNQS